jgi:hypothetical protein
MDDPKLTLHIGTEKTGSTSIQSYLRANRKHLNKLGICIPSSLSVGRGNHRWLPLIANNPEFTDEFTTREGLIEPSRRAKRINDKKNLFEREVSAKKALCNHFVISSEHLQSRLTTDEELLKLNEYLSKLFKSITIGLYIRDPLETAVSAYSSLLLANRAGSRLPAANSPYILNLCDHAATIARWKRCFPDARLVVRHFEEAKLSLGDIRKDFCLQFLQVDPCAIGMLPKRLNESYSLKGLTYIHWLNKVMPPRGGALATRLRYLVIDYLARLIRDESRFSPSREEQTAYYWQFRDSCEEVRREYFPERKRLFTQAKEIREESIDLNEEWIYRGTLVGLAHVFGNQNRKWHTRRL